MWNVAKNEAQKASGNDKGPEFKRFFFALSPEGLTVYVTSYEDVKPIKKLLIDKYRKHPPLKMGQLQASFHMSTDK